MQIQNDKLYFNYSELVPTVLSVENYKSQKKRGSITLLGRGGNGREVLIEADSLPEKYKLMAKALVCGGLEPGEYYLKSKIVNWLPYCPASDHAAIDQYRITKTRSDFETGEISTVDKEGLPTDAKDQYIMEARWILLMTEGYDRYKKELKNLQITSVEQFRTLCITIANSKGMKFGTNLVAFSRDKIRPYQQSGILGLVSKKWGNKSAEKVNEESLQTLIDLYAVRTKPTTTKITKAYNTIAASKGWDTVTEQTVYNNLYKPEVRQAWTLGRDGYDVWKREYEIAGTRFRATMPNALWIGDDTKVNLYYIDEKGLRAHLQVYAIVDSHSGYWLGRSYAEAKKNGSINASHVRDAFADSIEKSGGYLPFQMLYDNDGANSFYDRLTTLHFPCMPYNGQSKYIERMFKKVQEEFMADDEAFTGMNIQSKTDQSKRVPMKGHKQAHKCKEDAIRAMEHWFEVMNNTIGKDGRSPKQKFYGTKNPEAKLATAFNKYDMLYEWNQATITMTKSGIRMVHERREYIYDVIADGCIDTDFYEENIRREFKVKYNPRNMAEIVLYTPEERFITVAVEKRRLAEAVQDYRPDERKHIDELLSAKKRQLKKSQQKLQTANQVSDAALIIGNDAFRFHDKNVINQAEADMYTGFKQQDSEDVERYIDLEAERRARVRRQ